MMYVCYKIEIEGIIRYVGMTNNLSRREYQHKTDCFNEKSKQYNKKLYKWIREHNYTNDDIVLIPIYNSRNRVECKRYECRLILNDFFDKKEFIQNVPNISDFH